MAKLAGNLKIKGTLGDLSFIPIDDEIIVRQKSRLSAKRIAKDPAFERTRQQNQEFSLAVAAGRLIRKAFGSAVFGATDTGCVNRLSSRLFRILKSDRVNPRGSRTVAGGQMQLLHGFEFNEASPLQQRLLQRFTISLHPETGSVRATALQMVPDCCIVAPEPATHFRMVMASAALDLAGKKINRVVTYTEIMRCRTPELQDIELALSLPQGDRQLVTVMGIEFFEEVNKMICPLEKGAHNSMAVIMP